METAQEREVQLQGRQAWPFHMMATTSSNYSSSSSSSGSGGDCFVLGWEQPPFGCFGVLAADVHELFPLFADMESPLPVSSAPAVPSQAHDAVAMPEELDELLLNFWDASCNDGDVGEQQVQAAFNSSCCVPHEKSSSTVTTTNYFFPYDDDPLSSIFSAAPTLAEKALLQAPAEPLSSSSSNCHGDPHLGDAGGAWVQGAAATPSAARAPPVPRSSASLKRSTREESDQAECSQSVSKRRKAESPSPAGVVCPFALLKPDGLDGGATLADINARILMRPARPVRHPVGEFACAPRVSADQPGISGKTVSSFTRLHTPGRGTITIIRTRG
ncbi:uncharacterized protein LOC133896615 isoform X2 [Phragmites australis]|uniref:uncharacterized protein LOC133896615 isoform X2 n=1 Tax=Phragmites australis TaxID=29695 RepID=UPI002D76E13F|nr:uncharacterized protein LOC133896615 isoform X2 [Phragmites australis]